MAAETLISIVDDDQSLRTALVRLIRSLGYSARAFASAEEFIESGVLPDCSCVITDIQMPGMSGLDLTVLIARHRTPAPVIVLTARPEPHLEDSALASGAHCFLKKPVDASALAECVAKAVKR